LDSSRDGSFADDLPADLAAFMADAQVAWSVGALGGAVTGQRRARTAAAATSRTGQWRRPA
jgi:hypothetical protein